MTDFASILRRRRFTIERWLDSEQLASSEDLDAWMKHNSDYAYNSEFIAEAKSLLSPKVVKNALVVMQEFTGVLDEPDEEPLYVEIPQEFVESKRVKQKYPKSLQTTKEED